MSVSTPYLRHPSHPEFGPVYLSPSLYEAARAQGFDLTGYRKIEPIPVDLEARGWASAPASPFPVRRPANGSSPNFCKIFGR